MELATLRAKHAALAPVLTERSRRVWAATEAQAIGYGGTALVARATGVNRREIVTPDRRQILTPYSRCLKRQESFPVSMISQ